MIPNIIILINKSSKDDFEYQDNLHKFNDLKKLSYTTINL